MSAPAIPWRLPRQAMWFFVCAPPVLARLFDPHCASTIDNVVRSWLTLTLFTVITGVGVHLVFERVAERTQAWPTFARLAGHGLTTAAFVTAITYLLHGPIRLLYPEVGDDVPGMIWRGVLVSYGYLAGARFIQHLVERAAEERSLAHAERAAALEARLVSLTAQLQPHFLFNSLNVCAGLVPTRPEVAETMLDELASLLRYAVENSERRLVPLAGELDAAKAYLAVQSGRFGERLQHDVITSVDLGTAPWLPPMSLQPLVENAVQHGLDSEAGGHVRITLRREGVEFLIAIENSGGHAGPRRSTSGTGIGQRNVRDRLRLAYGEAAELVCGPVDGGGYRSLIRLPLEVPS